MMVEDSQKLEQVLLGLGIILLVVAAGFGLAGLEPRHAGVNIVFPQSDAACGFAIAAGLCFVSAAIIHTTRPEWRLTAPDKTSSRAR